MNDEERRIWYVIQDMRDDAIFIEEAANKLEKRGAHGVARQVRIRVKDWREQADEMERRGQDR